MNLMFTVLFLVLSIGLSPVGSYAQTRSFAQLEQEVYQLNNELKYNQAQALLLPVLQNDTFSADDKYQAALLLSYTYKRVFDYQSTLKFLDIARTFAESSPKRKQYLNTILAEEAFVRFDTQSYQTSDSLMRLLEQVNFNYISAENKSKLIMQQGYILFLNKQYEQAERTYNRAIGLMQVSSPCHLPMIYVKKMQLYDAINRLDLLNESLRRSVAYADSCHIIKYHIYAFEELRKIYTARDDLAGIARTQKKLDSLNVIYAREEQIAALHNQQEKFMSDDNAQKIKREQTHKQLLAIVAVGLFIVFVISLLVYSRQKRRKEVELDNMKAELGAYLTQSKKSMPDKMSLDISYTHDLSERQREVLELMATGASNKEIADQLFISENTVKYHIKNIYQLLEIDDRKKFLASLKK